MTRAYVNRDNRTPVPSREKEYQSSRPCNDIIEYTLPPEELAERRKEWDRQLELDKAQKRQYREARRR